MAADSERLRPGSKQVYLTLQRRLLAGDQIHAFVLPCRYGKSDLQRFCAIALHEQGLIATTLSLTPSKFLAQQLVNQDHIAAAQRRYSLGAFRFANLVKMPEYLNPNGEVFMAMTNQLALAQAAVLVQWLEAVRHQTGKPVLVFVDECHTVSEEKAWGGLIQAIRDAGAIIVLLTATAHRADGRKIPGFSYDEVGRSVTQERQWKPHPTELDKAIIELREVERLQVVLRADHEVPFSQAWHERVLCGVTHSRFDCALEIIRGKTLVKRLVDLTPEEAREHLGRIVRQPETVEAGVIRMLQVLAWYKSMNPQCAAMVYCGNDSDSDSDINRHAKAIESAIRQLAPFACRTQIVTSADGTDGPDRLRDFCNGANDVLIVKQMAGVGLDAPRVKVVLDLSPVRTYASCVQRWLRACTPFETPGATPIRAAVLITPEDTLACKFFDVLTRGMVGADTVRIAGDTIEITVVPRNDEPVTVTHVTASDFSDGAFHDHALRSEEATELGMVKQIGDEFPEILRERTWPQVVQSVRRLSAIITGTATAQESALIAPAEDTSKMVSERKRLINSYMRRVRRLHFGRYNPDTVEKEMQQVWRHLYRRARVPGKFEELNDLTMLDKLIETARGFLVADTHPGLVLDDEGAIVTDTR